MLGRLDTRLMKLEAKAPFERPAVINQHIIDLPNRDERRGEVDRMIAAGEAAATDIFVLIVAPNEEPVHVAA